MKKLAIITLSALLLTGCGEPSEEALENKKESNQRFEDGTRIIQDKLTGCKYIFTTSGYAGGMSALYKANGEIDCGEEG